MQGNRDGLHLKAALQNSVYICFAQHACIKEHAQLGSSQKLNEVVVNNHFTVGNPVHCMLCCFSVLDAACQCCDCEYYMIEWCACCLK